MLEPFYPKHYVSSAYVIPYRQLYEKGIRGVIFDVDNTLVPHDEPADERAEKGGGRAGLPLRRRGAALYRVCHRNKSNGPSSAIPFGLALIQALRDHAAAQAVAQGILL